MSDVQYLEEPINQDASARRICKIAEVLADHQYHRWRAVPEKRPSQGRASDSFGRADCEARVLDQRVHD